MWSYKVESLLDTKLICATALRMPITTALEIVSITNPSMQRKQSLHIAETENPDEV